MADCCIDRMIPLSNTYLPKIRTRNEDDTFRSCSIFSSHHLVSSLAPDSLVPSRKKSEENPSGNVNIAHYS